MGAVQESGLDMSCPSAQTSARLATSYWALGGVESRDTTDGRVNHDSKSYCLETITLPTL